MKQKLYHLVKSEGVQQSALLAVGNVGATGFSAISLIILSRYLGPESFGGFSVAFSLTQIMAKFGDLGLNLGLQRLVAQAYSSNPAKAAAAIRYVGKIKLIAILLLAGIGLVIGPILAKTLFHVSEPALITLGVCLSVATVLYEYVLVMIQATAQFTTAVFMNAAQAILKCAFAIGSWLWLPAHAVGVFVWYALAPLAGVLVGFQRLGRYLTMSITSQAIKPELFKVAQFGAINVMALVIADNVDTLMVNAMLSEFDTGLYAAANRVALMLLLVGMSFGTVFNTRVAQYRNKTDLDAFLHKAVLFAVVCLAAIPFVMLISKPLLLITAGSSFLGGVSTLNYLMAASLLYAAIVPFIAVFYAVDYPAYFAISGVIQTVLLVGADALLIPTFGIAGAGLGKVIARTALAIYTIVIAYQAAHRQYRTHVPSLNQLQKVFHVVSS